MSLGKIEVKRGNFAEFISLEKDHRRKTYKSLNIGKSN